jgi:iron complex outermembrane receptor protein
MAKSSVLNAALVATTLLSSLSSPIVALAADSAATSEATENAASSGDATSAGGGDQLQEVIVTARRRAESIEKVPVAVTAVQQSTIQNYGAFTVSELTQVVPGLDATSQTGNRNDVFVFIRGQGYTYTTTYPGVVTYVSEVPIPRLNAGQFYDLQNTQVLRGPQGTLFGRNTTGGAILLQPNTPSDTFGGYGEIGAGNYGLASMDGAINLPLSDIAAIRLAVLYRHRDGYTIDQTTGVDYDNLNWKSARLSVLLKPTDAFQNLTTFNYHYDYSHGTGELITEEIPAVTTAATGTPFFGQLLSGALAQQQQLGVRKVNLSAAPPIDQELDYIISNTTTYHLNDDLLVKNIFGYSDLKETYSSDIDGSKYVFVDGIGTVPYQWTKQYSDELQLQGNSFHNTLTYIAGLYADYQEPGGPEATTENELLAVRSVTEQFNYLRSKAAFLQGTYDFSSFLDGLKFTAGTRYTEDGDHTQLANYTGLIGGAPPACSISVGCPLDRSANFHGLTYDIDLDYQVTPNTLVYVAHRKGYKSGGFTSYFGGPINALEFRPEYITDWEVGTKSQFDIVQMPTRVNLAVYRGNYTDIQRLIDAVAPSGIPYSVVTNAPSAIVQGAELEMLFKPFAGLTVGLNWAYTDAYFNGKNDPTQLAYCQPGVFGGFCPLNQFTSTPRNQASVDAHYEFKLPADAGNLVVGGRWYYQSTVALADGNYTVFPTPAGEFGGLEAPYHILNLDASWKGVFNSQADVSFFMTNATNTVYRVGAADVVNALGFVSSVYGPPRMFGFNVRYSFGGEARKNE